MSFAQSVLAPWALLLTWLLSLAVIAWALWGRPWQVLIADSALQHRWLGATLAVMLMWQLRAQAVDWLTLHLVFTVLMTLVFKAPLALISNVLINIAMVVIGRNEWMLLGANVLVTGIVPAAVIGTVWRLVDRRLPDNLMVFLFASSPLFKSDIVTRFCSWAIFKMFTDSSGNRVSERSFSFSIRSSNISFCFLNILTKNNSHTSISELSVSSVF